MVGNRLKRSPVWAHLVQKKDGGVCNICSTFVQGKGGNTSNLIKHLRLRHNINLNPCLIFEHMRPASNKPDRRDQQRDGHPTAMTVASAREDTEEPPQVPKIEGPQLPQLEDVDASPSTSVPPSVTVGHVKKQVTQVTLGALASLKKRKMTRDQSDNISRAITRYIVKEMQPFSTIGSESFRCMLAALNPEYIPPNKETLSSVYIPAWYNVEVDKLKQSLALALGVGITADHWTSLNGDHYLTITAHFVEDWKLMNKVLETKAVYPSQTGEAIGTEINECLEKFGIAGKVVGITVDNAANMAAGANFLNIMRLPCFAHTMNVAASKLYNEMNFTKWLARIRSVVVWFKRVHMASVVLKENLAALDLPNHTVILDVKTRWNSMYLMVERFAEIYPGLCAAARDPRIKKRVDKEKVERISDSDLKKSEEFVKCMRILYTGTLAISSDTLPTVGQVMPSMMRLKKCFTVDDDDSDFVKMVKTVVWNNLEQRYKEPEIVNFLEESSALDPRFKVKMLQNNDVWGRIETKVASMIQRDMQPAEVKVEPGSSALSQIPDGDADENHLLETPGRGLADSEAPDSHDSDEKPTLKRKRSAIAEMFEEDEDSDNDVIVTTVVNSPSPETQAHMQVEHYKSVQGIKKDCNPLEFYKNHHEQFPKVAALALTYVCVSGSSVPSERVFSLAGNTISQERVRIDPEKADMLIFLHKKSD